MQSTATTFRVEEQAKEETSMKQAAIGAYG
jgi:hypothetical protein